MVGFRKYIFVYINPDNLLLACATLRNKTLTYHNAASFPLSDLDVHSDTIFNPSKFMALIRHYAAQQALKTKHLVILTPHLQTANPFQLLQTALVFSKDTFIIHHLGNDVVVITAPNGHIKLAGPNLLNTFLPAGFQATRSLALLTSFLVAAALAGSLYTQRTAHACTLQLDKQIHQEQTALAPLKQSVAQLHTTKNRIKTLEKKIAPLTVRAQQNIHQQDLLNSIANTIPNTSKLTELKIEKRKATATPHKSTLLISLKGKTMRPEEIGLWAQQLSQALPTASFQLASLRKISSKTKSHAAALFYRFSLTGIISPA